MRLKRPDDVTGKPAERGRIENRPGRLGGSATVACERGPRSRWRIGLGDEPQRSGNRPLTVVWSLLPFLALAQGGPAEQSFDLRGITRVEGELAAQAEISSG